MCVCISECRLELVCEKQSWSMLVLNIGNDLSIERTPRSLWEFLRYLSTYCSMDLNHTEKNILISCLSSPADADVCMCLLVELCRQKEWELNIFFFPFYLNSFCHRSSVNMCWARQAGQARGKAQGLLFTPLCLYFGEVVDRQTYRPNVQGAGLSFSPSASWVAVFECRDFPVVFKL